MYELPGIKVGNDPELKASEDIAALCARVV